MMEFWTRTGQIQLLYTPLDVGLFPIVQPKVPWPNSILFDIWFLFLISFDSYLELIFALKKVSFIAYK